MNQPRLLVFTTVFPHAGQPHLGLFIRERMFRVDLPMVVVVPIPWFPFQKWIRWFKPNFRPDAPKFELQQGIQVYFPRFFSFPGLFKSLDGFFMALGCLWTLKRLKKTFGFNLVDAHFAYPDGFAAGLLARWLDVPLSITLRGTEVSLGRFESRKKRLIQALHAADQIFSVSQSLKDHAVGLGIEAEKIQVVSNGVDIQKFYPLDKIEARKAYEIDPHAKVLISVGGLVSRKGFHRVIEILPELIEKYPDLIYLIVGGPSPEGDMREELMQQVARLNLSKQVRFLGALPPQKLNAPLSCADLFVLATSNEGWANVFLEAMACGLPIVTTDVGGNKEVVGEHGFIAPFGDSAALKTALQDALEKNWNRPAIVAYARLHGWEPRVQALREAFQRRVL